MAQVYSFVDDNGVTRLFAEIHPDPAGTPFNGGTITAALNIAPAAGHPNTAPLTIAAASDQTPAADVDLLLVTSPTGPVSLFLDLESNGSLTSTFDDTHGGQFAVVATSTTRLMADGTGLGFFGHAPAAQPTGVAVTAAGIHAALVSLGLITA